MRLSLIPWMWGVAALVAAPALGQHRLPARAFEPSLAAVAPEPAPPVAEWWRNGGPRIRPSESRAASLLRTGLERSERVRALAAAIDAADVVVYMDLDRRMDSGLAGRLTFLGNAGTYRYVRVAINGGLGSDLMIASLAHELQHVVELIEHPEVTSEKALKTLYQRIGLSSRAGGVEGWETRAAREVTAEVRRELSAAAVAALARRDPPEPTGRGDDRRREQFY